AQSPPAHPTGAHGGGDQGERPPQPMQEGATRHTGNNRDNRGALIEVLMGRPPRLPWATRPGTSLGRLTLGEALGVQSTRWRQQRSACEALPALGAILVPLVRLLLAGSDRALPFPPFPSVCGMGK